MSAEQIIARASELLWTGALAATPVGAAVAAICRVRRLRPPTRHLLWLAVLASFLTPMVGSLLWKPYWFRSDRLMAAADSVLAASPAPNLSAPAHDPPATPPPARPSSTKSGTNVRTPGPAHEPLPAGSVAPLLAGRSYGAWFDAPALPQLADTHEQTLQAATELASSDFVGPLRDEVSCAVTSGSAPAPMTFGNEADSRRLASPESASTTPMASATPSFAVPLATQQRRGAVRIWLSRVLAVRDAIADLPPVPPSVWFGGALFVVLLSIWRRCLGMLWLRGATPAGAHVQALVRQVGETLGMPRTPRVVFVDAAVSPMIWCGLRPLLVLPTQLWRTLDDDSRRAVLVHELAHVRRWDHVMCWLVAAVGAVYWWHPVAWWARRRLHEEAEASCDA